MSQKNQKAALGLMDRVRAACKAVSEGATYVRIDYDRIRSYVVSLPLLQAMTPEIDPNYHYVGRGEDTVAFFLTLDTINFGSGYFPHLRKHPGLSGYFTIASSLNEHYEKHGPTPAHELAELTMDDCLAIFGQDREIEPVRELMQLFTTALNHLGRYLLGRFNGSFVGPVEAANASAEALVKLLREMPYFNDIASYDGLEVPFYKRAQLAAADLSLAFKGEGPGRFDDLDRLTIFADNLVPHVLRVDGILLYEKKLAARIDAEELIPAGSQEEVEIRACALEAVEQLAHLLRESGQKVNAMELDFLLWNRGQQSYYKKVYPRHRTRTVFY